jgi:hypothetical protein
MGAWFVRLGSLLAMAALLTAVPVAVAAPSELVWRGPGQNWSEGANWEGGQAPAEADGVIDLSFPLGACERCQYTTDDVPGLTVGTLTLPSRSIAFTAKAPFEPPPSEPAPLTYAVAGHTPLKLARGIAVPSTLEGVGEGIASPGGTVVSTPLVLTADNVWSVGPAPGASLDVSGSLSGPHRLAIALAEGDQLELAGMTDVGPIAITGVGGSNVVLGDPAIGGDVNGTDGEPLIVEGVSLSGGGRIGPLTLRDSSLNVGYHGSVGPLNVNGGVEIAGHASVAFELASSKLSASGHVVLGSALLRVYWQCPSVGATFPLVEAAGGVSGVFTGPAGETLPSGTVLPPLGPNGCGPGRPSPPLRLEYSADAVTVTALAPAATGSPPTQSPVGTQGIGGVSGYTQSYWGALARGLAALRVAAIPKLLRRGGESVSVQLPAAGTLAITWTAAVGRHHKPVVVAFGRLRLAAAGGGRLRLRLTHSGRALLAHASHVKITVTETFAGAGLAPIALNEKLTLHR